MTRHATYTLYIGALRGKRIPPSYIATTLAEHGLAGATVSDTDGLWKGKWELATRIEIVEENLDWALEKIRAVAQSLRRAHGQESVLLTVTPCAVHFIEG